MRRQWLWSMWPETYARRFQRQGILTREQADAVCGRMETYEASDLLGRTLQALGHRGLVYRNSYEDPGSTSWIVLSPDQVSPLGPPVRVAVRDLESLLEREGPLSMADVEAMAPVPVP